MAEHTATVTWHRAGAQFTNNRYSRAHQWAFDGGAVVHASASPHVVPVPLSDPHAVDPEEAFVAALSSCHMLWFLSIAARRGVTVESYRDEAIGYMERDPAGRLAITRVVLRPHIALSGPRMPDADEIARIHEEAHHQCFLANSVRTTITVESPASSV